MRPLKPAIIVEHDVVLRGVLKELVIEETPFWPLLADTCAKAIELLKKSPETPELAIVDQGLPDQTGLDCILRLREIEMSVRRVEWRSCVRSILLSKPPIPHIPYWRPVIGVALPFDYDKLVDIIHCPRGK